MDIGAYRVDGFCIIGLTFFNNIKHKSYHEDACSVTGTDVPCFHNKRHGCFLQGQESDHFH